MKIIKFNKRLRKKRHLGFTLLFMLLAFQGFTLSGIRDSIITHPERGEWKTLKTLYLELGGKFFPSVNLDVRTRENLAFTFGTGIWHDNEEHEQWLLIPSVNASFLFGRKKQFEIGAGTGPFISTYLGLASVLIFGNIGYRYQRAEHFFFRASLSPFVGFPVAEKSRFMLTPWAGFGFGYTF
jgi:hypothetical protein